MYNLFTKDCIRVEDVDLPALQVTMETFFPSLSSKQTMLHRSEKFLFLAIQILAVIRAFHVLWASKHLWWIGLFYPKLG